MQPRENRTSVGSGGGVWCVVSPVLRNHAQWTLPWLGGKGRGTTGPASRRLARRSAASEAGGASLHPAVWLYMPPDGAKGGMPTTFDHAPDKEARVELQGQRPRLCPGNVPSSGPRETPCTSFLHHQPAAGGGERCHASPAPRRLAETEEDVRMRTDGVD